MWFLERYFQILKELINYIKEREKNKNIWLNDDHIISSLAYKNNIPLYMADLDHEQDTQDNKTERLKNTNKTMQLEEIL